MQEANPAVNLKKLAAIPVLIVILAMVMRSNGSQEEAVPETGTSLSAASFQEKKSPKQAIRRDREWPDMNLEELLCHNPFSNSLLVQEAKLTKSTGIDSNVIKVDAFLSSSSGTVAMAEKKMYRVGDQLPDGRIVDSVSDEFIYLKREPSSR